MLEGVDYKGRTLLSIIAINVKPQHEREFIDVHVITSVYGKRDIEKYIKAAETEGRLINTKKEESPQGITKVQYDGDINATSSNSDPTTDSPKSQVDLKKSEKCCPTARPSPSPAISAMGTTI